MYHMLDATFLKHMFFGKTIIFCFEKLYEEKQKFYSKNSSKWLWHVSFFSKFKFSSDY